MLTSKQSHKEKNSIFKLTHRTYFFMFYCTLFCSVLSLHNSSVQHELEEQIVHEDKGYPLRMVKRKIVVLCYFKSKLVLSSERDT